VAPDTIKIFRFCPLGGATIWPLENGIEELAETIFETTG